MQSINPNAQIIRLSNYSIRVLTILHRQAVIKLLAQQFFKKQPLGNAYFRLFPQKEKNHLKQQTQFWTLFADDLCTNNLSIGLFDMNNDGQLVGVTVGKDVRKNPQGFPQMFEEQCSYFHVIKISKKIFEYINPSYSSILNNQNLKVLQLWGFALKDQHMGKKLLHKMVLANQYLAHLQNYQYSLVWQSHYKSGIALKKLEYFQISRINVAEYEHKGVRYFERIEEDQKWNILWLKKINSFKGNQLPLKFD